MTEVTYRGFRLTARREEGDCWYMAERVEDGWVLIDGYGDMARTERGCVSYMKGLVDRYHEGVEP